MSKICEKCGAELKDTARVCTLCGAPAAPPEQPYLNRPVKPTPHITEKFGNEADSQTEKQVSVQPEKKHTAITVIAAVLLVIVLAVGGFFGYLALSGKSPSDVFSGLSDSNEQSTAAITALMLSEVKDV